MTERRALVVALALVAVACSPVPSVVATSSDAASDGTVPGPGAVSPTPVLLVPGWSDTGSALARLRERFVEAGWPASHVVAVTFRDPTGGNYQHAGEISEAVELLLARTGARQLDVVAHSMGGLAARVYMLENPARVRRVVFMATPHRGTTAAYFAFGEGRGEMLPGSDFLEALNASPAVPPGVEALTLRTFLDTHILPGSSATLAGIPDVSVCCPTHQGLTRDAEAFHAVLAFLLLGTVT